MLSALVHLMSADMKTSHGEPATICCSSVLDEPELTTRLQLYCLSNAAVMFATTLVRLDAMNTVRVMGAGVGVGTGLGEGVAVGMGVADGFGVPVAVGVGLRVGEGVGLGVAVAVGVGEGCTFEAPVNVPLPAR